MEINLNLDVPLRQITGPDAANPASVHHSELDCPLIDRSAHSLESATARLMNSGVVLDYCGPDSQEIQRMLASGDINEQRDALLCLYQIFSETKASESKTEAARLLLFGGKELPAEIAQALENLEDDSLVQDAASAVMKILIPRKC